MCYNESSSAELGPGDIGRVTAWSRQAAGCYVDDYILMDGLIKQRPSGVCDRRDQTDIWQRS